MPSNKLEVAPGQKRLGTTAIDCRMIPSSFTLSNCSILGRGRHWTKMTLATRPPEEYSFVLERLILNLFSVAHSFMFSNSAASPMLAVSGFTKLY